MLHIKNIAIPSRMLLAPISGVSDLPFRMLNRQHGCEFAFYEMINARTLNYQGRKTKLRLHTVEADKPIGIQLLGAQARYVLDALDALRGSEIELLDFNAACPEKKVIRRGEGAAMMRDPVALQDMLRLIVERSDWPVTVKIRSGWDCDSINAADVAARAEDAGVAAIFIHGRTRQQFYSGVANYDVIREVKKRVAIPVIGSGDILSAQQAKKMFDETGCDGILVARGAFGNPWIFSQIRQYLDHGTLIEKPDVLTICRTMQEHLDATIKVYGEKTGIVVFRKFFIWYTRGFHNVRPLREQASQIKRHPQMTKLIEECLACQTRTAELSNPHDF
jgi:tRNA-dihydrouridine synthase B